MAKKIIKKKDVEYVAKLAKLKLNEEQKDLFLKQLNDILFYFKKLNELETDHLNPTFHILQSSSSFHEDVPKPSLPQNAVMNLTQNKKNGYFKVPKVL